MLVRWDMSTKTAHKIIMGTLINRRKRRLASDLFNPPILARDPCPVPSYSHIISYMFKIYFTTIEKISTKLP